MKKKAELEVLGSIVLMIFVALPLINYHVLGKDMYSSVVWGVLFLAVMIIFFLKKNKNAKRRRRK